MLAAVGTGPRVTSHVRARHGSEVAIVKFFQVVDDVVVVHSGASLQCICVSAGRLVDFRSHGDLGPRGLPNRPKADCVCALLDIGRGIADNWKRMQWSNETEQRAAIENVSMHRPSSRLC